MGPSPQVAKPAATPGSPEALSPSDLKPLPILPEKFLDRFAMVRPSDGEVVRSSGGYVIGGVAAWVRAARTGALCHVEDVSQDCRSREVQTALMREVIERIPLSRQEIVHALSFLAKKGISFRTEIRGLIQELLDRTLSTKLQTDWRKWRLLDEAAQAVLLERLNRQKTVDVPPGHSPVSSAPVSSAQVPPDQASSLSPSDLSCRQQPRDVEASAAPGGGEARDPAAALEERAPANSSDRFAVLDGEIGVNTQNLARGWVYLSAALTEIIEKRLYVANSEHVTAREYLAARSPWSVAQTYRYLRRYRALRNEFGEHIPSDVAVSRRLDGESPSGADPRVSRTEVLVKRIRRMEAEAGALPQVCVPPLVRALRACLETLERRGNNGSGE